jgi:molybdate transport system ATP-binding protein
MTLKCIAGVVKPDRGTIAVGGRTLFDSKKKINLSPQERRVGLLFQNYALFPNMTVEQNIAAVLARRGEGDVKARLASLVERFYIGGLERHYPANLSGGQQQRVALARILASDPTVLMLDEPLSALDSYLRWQLEEELMDLFAEFGGTTLYVSHNRDEVYRLCSRVCVMRDGANEPIRPVGELFEQPNTLASSLLSGCKNYSRVRRLDDNTIRALDWGVDLRTAGSADDDTRYAGVRAHYVKICDEGAENAFLCRVTRVIQDVFSAAVNLRPEGVESKHDFTRIRMELSKDEASAIRSGDRLWIRIAPSDIMPLRE